MIVSRDQLRNFIMQVYPFDKMDETSLSFLAEKCEIVFYKKGDLVYQEGAAARFLYVLLEGQMNILKEVKQLIVSLNHVRVGDVFGEDVLDLNCTRHTTTRAETDSLLIRIRLSSLTQIIKQSPAIQSGLQLLLRSYQILIRNVSKVSNEEESLRFISHPHEFSWILKPLLGGFVLMPACAIFIRLAQINWLSVWHAAWIIGSLSAIFMVWIVWHYWRWRNHWFIFTNLRAIHHATNFPFQEIREETPLNAVVSLARQTNCLGRKFGFGRLSIKTLTGLLQLRFVPFLDETQNLLEFLIEKQKRENKLHEKKEFEALLQERFASPGGISDETDISLKQAGKRMQEKPEMRDFVGWIFGLRRKIGTSIIYRTHWVFLIKKTFFPFLVWISLLLLEVYFRTNQIAFFNSSYLVWIFRLAEILALMVWLYQFMDWRNDQYIITPDQIVDVYQKPLGLTDRREAPIENIQSIRVERQGIAGMLLDYGNVFVKVGNEDFSFDGVNHPIEIQQTLFGLLERTHAKEKEEERIGQQRCLLDWLETYQRFTGENSMKNQSREE